VILGGILLAFLCWGITFGWAGGNFWVKIGISVLTVTSYSLLWQRPVFLFRWSSVGLGILSAAVLYFLFFVGNVLAPYVVQEAPVQVGGIYGLGRDTSRIPIFLLLFLVTGPGEEIFWRGFLQSRMMARLGNIPGYLVTTAVYAAVHVFSLNFVLTMAALLAGAFWGGLYLWRRDLTLLIVSHSLWSAVIFSVAPMG
jgi:uncharacterized protein